MSNINHPFFGLLSTDKLQDTDVIWEVPQTLDGQSIETWLWADPASPLQPLMLDQFEGLLNRLPELDQQARAALIQHLQEDPEFIACHADMVQDENAENLPATTALLAKAQAAGQPHIAAADFVTALRIENISLWCSHDDAPLVLDYRIDPQGSDQILAVKCDAQGQILEIDWES